MNLRFFVFFFFNRNVGGNIRDGISGLSGSVMSKPREFAHLIKNKFGSADNINQLSSSKFKLLIYIAFAFCMDKVIKLKPAVIR